MKKKAAPSCFPPPARSDFKPPSHELTAVVGTLLLLAPSSASTLLQDLSKNFDALKSAAEESAEPASFSPDSPFTCGVYVSALLCRLGVICSNVHRAWLPSAGSHILAFSAAVSQRDTFSSRACDSSSVLHRVCRIFVGCTDSQLRRLRGTRFSATRCSSRDYRLISPLVRERCTVSSSS